MEVFQSQIQSRTEEFKTRCQSMKAKAEDLKSKLKKVQTAGFNSSLPQLKSKMAVRLKIQKLLDPSSHFLEFSPLAGYKMYNFSAPSAGLITGIGMIEGRQCVVIANDPLVKAGAYLPITVKKHLRAQEIALQNHLPCIYLVDSGGAYLPQQDEIFPDRDHFGGLFYNQSQMSALGLEQIAVVCGLCTAGGAYIPALSDHTIMIKEKSAVFLGGPPLVFSATGEKVSAQDLGGASLHTKKSGVADYFAENEEEALEKARCIIASIPKRKRQREVFPIQAPLYDPEEIYGIIPEDVKHPLDIRELLARIVDGSQWLEFKKNYGETLVTVSARIGGFPVGILAGNGILFRECALKAVHFIDLCERKNIPLIFFQNISGFIVGKKYESEGIAKDGAKMVMAVSLARVPKFTVIIGASYGAGNYGMCGRAYRPRQLWMWPSGKIGVMGGKAATDVLSSIGKKNLTAGEKEKLLQKYEAQNSPYYSTARLWDDGLIDPLDTRKALALGLSAAANSFPEERKKGVYRM